MNIEYPQEWLVAPVEKQESKQTRWRTDPKIAGKSNSVGRPNTALSRGKDPFYPHIHSYSRIPLDTRKVILKLWPISTKYYKKSFSKKQLSVMGYPATVL